METISRRKVRKASCESHVREQNCFVGKTESLADVELSNESRLRDFMALDNGAEILNQISQILQ